MPEQKYFLKLTGIMALGVVSLILGFGIFLFLFPYLIAIGLTLLLISLVFLVIWMIVYIIMVLGALVVYFFKPVEVKKKGDYSVQKVKESGKRQKGKA